MATIDKFAAKVGKVVRLAASARRKRSVCGGSVIRRACVTGWAAAVVAAVKDAAVALTGAVGTDRPNGGAGAELNGNGVSVNQSSAKKWRKTTIYIDENQLSLIWSKNVYNPIMSNERQQGNTEKVAIDTIFFGVCAAILQVIVLTTFQTFMADQNVLILVQLFKIRCNGENS